MSDLEHVQAGGVERPGASSISSARAHQGAPTPHPLSDTSGSPDERLPGRYRSWKPPTPTSRTATHPPAPTSPTRNPRSAHRLGIENDVPSVGELVAPSLLRRRDRAAARPYPGPDKRARRAGTRGRAELVSAVDRRVDAAQSNATRRIGARAVQARRQGRLLRDHRHVVEQILTGIEAGSRDRQPRTTDGGAHCERHRSVRAAPARSARVPGPAESPPVPTASPCLTACRVTR